MQKYNFSHTHKWLWIYLLLVSLCTLAIYLLIFYEISTSLHFSSISSAIDAGQSSTGWKTDLQIKILLLMAAGFAFVALSGILWVCLAGRRLTRPIGVIQNSIYRLARGNLNETVTLQSEDEFGQIGANINELAANLQELLLYVWKQTGQCLDLLEQMKAQQPPPQGAGIQMQVSAEESRRLIELSSSLQDLREMAKFYVFYDVQLKDERTLAINDFGHIPPAKRACNE